MVAAVCAGQDPEKHPEKFTPMPQVEPMQWPSNEEAFAWAEAAKKRVRKRQLFEMQLLSEKKTPGVAAGGSSSPVTNENQPPEQAAPPPAAVPFQLSSQ